MSRGLDIEDVENVINYDVPPFIKTYVHRYVGSATPVSDEKGDQEVDIELLFLIVQSWPNSPCREGGQDVYTFVEVRGSPLQGHAEEGRTLFKSIYPRCLGVELKRR